MKPHTLTRAQAETAAREFIAKYVDHDLTWTVACVEGFLPHRHQFKPGVEDSDFFPITVKHVADVILSNAQSYADEVNP